MNPPDNGAYDNRCAWPYCGGLYPKCDGCLQRHRKRSMWARIKEQIRG